VKAVDSDELSAKLQSSDRVSQLIQGRRPERDAHHVGHDQHEGAAAAALGRQTDLLMSILAH